MKTCLVLLALCIGGLVAWPALAEVADVSAGATGGYVDVASSTEGVRIGPDGIRTALRVRVKEGAASVVCFNYVDAGTNCATALTSADNAGFCASEPLGGYIFMVSDEHWRGQVCAINFGAGTSRVGWNAW